MFFDVDPLDAGSSADDRSASDKKKDALGLYTENISGIQHVDGDTFKDSTGNKYRFNRINTFESSPEAFLNISPLSQSMQVNEASRVLGKSREDVTIEDITRLGKIGKEAFEKIASGDVRGLKLGKDIYGRTLVDIYDENGDSVQGESALGAYGINAAAHSKRASKENRINEILNEKRDALGFKIENMPSGYGQNNSPELQQREDGLYNYGQLKGVTREAYDKMGRFEDEHFKDASGETWASKVPDALRGVANIGARTVTGIGGAIDTLMKGSIDARKYTTGDTLREKAETWNSKEAWRHVDLDNPGLVNVEISENDIKKYEAGEDVGGFKQEALDNLNNELGQKEKDIKAIDDQAKLDSRRVDKIEDYRSSDKFKRDAEESAMGIFGAILQTPSRAPNLAAQFFESIGHMAAYTNVITGAPMLASATQEAISENTKEFTKHYNRPPTENEKKFIAVLSFAGEAIDGLVAFKLLKGGGGLGRAMDKFASKAPATIQALPQFSKNMITEFFQESATSLSGEIASKQKDTGAYDFVQIAEDGVRGFYGAGGISIGGVFKKGPITDEQIIARMNKTIDGYNKIITDKTSSTEDKSKAQEDLAKLKEGLEGSINNEETTDQQKANAQSVLDKINVKSEPVVKKASEFKATEGLGEGGETTTNIVNTSVQVLTGKETGDKTQAVVDLISVIQNAETLYGENSEVIKENVSKIIKDNAQEIFAASEELTKIKEATEQGLGVVLGSLGSNEKLNIDNIENLSKAEIDAVTAINKAIETHGTLNMKRVTGEISESETQNNGVKGYLQSALKTGIVAAGFSRFNTHMQSKSKAFTEAFKSGTDSYIAKSTSDYTIHTEVPSDAILNKSKTGYTNYYKIHKGSGKFVKQVENDAALVSEFHGFAEAIAAGQKNRIETVDVAKELSTAVKASGALDTGDIGTDGKIKEEKIKGKAKETTEEAGTKPQQQTETGTTAEPLPEQSAKELDDIGLQEDIDAGRGKDGETILPQILTKIKRQIQNAPLISLSESRKYSKIAEQLYELGYSETQIIERLKKAAPDLLYKLKASTISKVVKDTKETTEEASSITQPSTPILAEAHPEQHDFAKGLQDRTSYQEHNGIGYSEYTNPETGIVDTYLAAFGDNDFIGYMRVYENGKPTNRFTSKLEVQSKRKGAAKEMLLKLSTMLPKGHEYTENDTISTDGLRHFQNQLRNGYEVVRDKNGNVVTSTSILSGASRNNDLGVGQAGDFNNLNVNQAEAARVSGVVSKLLAPFGLDASAVRHVGSNIHVQVPVLRKINQRESEQTKAPVTQNQTTAESIKHGMNAIAEGAALGMRDQAADYLRQGKTDRLTYHRPDAIAAAKQSEHLNTVDNADGSVTVIGVRDSNNEWVGKQPSNSKPTQKEPVAKPKGSGEDTSRQGDSGKPQEEHPGNIPQQESAPMPTEEVGQQYSEDSKETTDIGVEELIGKEHIGLIKDSVSEFVGDGVSVEYVPEVTTRDSGKTKHVVGSSNKKGNSIVISTNKKVWDKLFGMAVKAGWVKDGDIEGFTRLVVAHEHQHILQDEKRKDESYDEYEKRINDAALEQISTGIKEPGVKVDWFADIKSRMVNIGREYAVTMAEVIKHTVSKKDSFLSGTPLRMLSKEAKKNREIARLAKEFKQAGEEFIDPDDRKQNLHYSFNNLMVNDSSGKLIVPEQYYHAMATAFASWIAASGRKTLTNSLQDISGILYGEMSHSLTASEVDSIAGIGTPLYMVAEGLGGNMSKVLGFKIEIPKGMSREDKAMLGKLTDQKSFDRALGLMALELAGKLESKPVTITHHPALFLGKNSTVERRNKKDNTIDLNTVQLVNKEESLIDTFSKSEEYFENINGVKMEEKDIHLTGPKESIQSSVSGSISKLPKNRQTMLRKLQDVIWKPITANMETFLSFTLDQQKAIAGWKTTDGVHVDQKPKVEAKNNQILKQIKDLAELKKNQTSKFWFGYYLMNQYRIMIDSNGINPLSSKNLHRFTVNNEKTAVTFKKGGKHDVLFRYSIAQALDRDIDKKDHASVLEEFDKVVVEYGDLAQNLTGQAMVDAGLNVHALAGLIALKEYMDIKDGEEMTTHLGIEVDGTTNGYFLGLLQFPNDADGQLWNNLARVGITDTKGKYESNIKTVIDAYNRAGEGFTKALGMSLPTFEMMYGKKVDRNLMKGPFMIFNYGASSHKAAHGIARKLTNRIYEGKVTNAQFREFGIEFGIELENGFDLDSANFMTTKISDGIAELELAIQNKFTKIIEEAFEPLVGSTSEIKKALGQAMDSVASGFAVEFAEKSRELIGELVVNGPVHPEFIGNTKNKKAGQPIRLSKDGLTQLEMRQVADSLIDTHYPLLSGAWNESNEGEKQAFIDMVSRDRVQNDEQVHNAMFKDYTREELKAKLTDMVNTLESTPDTEENKNKRYGQALNISKLVKSQPTEILRGGLIRFGGKPGNKIDINKLVKRIENDITKVPTDSTVSLGGFAYGHPGAKMLVRSIQNLDASIMGKTVAESDSFLGLHDAVYVGIDKIQETTDRINQNALELSKEYSIAEAVLEQFKKVKENVEQADRRLITILNKHFKGDRAYEVKALYEQANRRLDTWTKKKEDAERFGDSVVDINKQLEAIVEEFAKAINKHTSVAKMILSKELPAIDTKANVAAWDADYFEKSKEQKDVEKDKKRSAKYRKNPTYTPPSQKLESLQALVAKNNKDRVDLFSKIGEMVQYYLPDSRVEQKDVTLESLGISSEQDIQQDAVNEILRGNTTAENVGQVNEMLGADNKDITRVLKELVQPLVAKIDGLSISLKGYANGVYAEGQFRSADNAVEMVYNISGPETRTEQTAQEVFGHEMIHAVSWRAVKYNQRFRRKLEQLRDAIAKDITVKDFLVDGDTSETAKKLAERQYLAVFGKDNLQEFLAYGLSNPVLIKKLKALEAKESKWFDGDTWYEKVFSALVKAIETVENLINKESNENAYEQLLSMAQEVNGINQSKASKIAAAINTGKFYDKSDEAIKGFVAKHEKFVRSLIAHAALKGMKVSYGATRLFPKFKGPVGERITTAAQIATLTPALLSKLLLQLTGKDIVFTKKNGDKVTLGIKDKDGNLLDPGKALIYSLAEVQKIIEGDAARQLFKLVTDVTGKMPVDMQRKLSESKRNVEQARESAKKLIRTLFNREFGDRKPTSSESRMLTKSVGKTDLQSLLGTYDTTVIAQLITSESKLNALIQQEKKALKLTGWWYKQAMGLSQRMVYQEQDGHLIFDNVIAMQKHAPSESSDLARMDRFITLLALQKTKGRDKLTNFIEENSNGFDHTIRTFANLNSANKESFVGSEILMTKGHIPKIGDKHRSIQFASNDSETKKQMKLKGYKFKGDLENYAGEQVGLYLATNLPMETQVKGLLSRTGKHMAHTSMMAKWKEDYNAVIEADKRNYKDLKKYQRLMMVKELTIKRKGKALRPVLNEKGKIVDLTIDMPFEVEEQLLGLNMDVVEVSSTSSMNTVDKINSEAVNEEGIDLLISRQEEHRPGNEWEFIDIMDVSSKDYSELFTRLPYVARKKIKEYAKQNKGKFYVEEVWLDAIFGYENWSVGNLIKDESIKRKVKIIEEVVKGIVGTINNNIVVKTPVVWGGNFASNYLTSVISGLGTIETIRYWKEGLDSLKEYQKNAAEVQEIDFLGRTDVAYAKANEKRREILTDKMNKSSVSELMDAGLYSAITTEEMQTDEYSYKNKAVRAISEATGKIKGGKTLGEVVKVLYLAEDTRAYKSLLGLVQVSDFLGRYGIYRKMVDEQGKSKDEAYSYVQDVFVDFNIPVGKITQYANSMGMIMFYKYWSRIQRATLGMIKHHPTKSMQILLMRSMLGMEIDTILNSGIITNGNMAPMGGWTNPINMIQQFITPSGLEIGIGLGGSYGVTGIIGALGVGAATAEGIVKDNGGRMPSSSASGSFQRTSSMGMAKDNAELSKRMIKSLRDKYPEISVKIVDKLVDKHGEEIFGQAIKSMVLINKNAALDTYPHEYAHIYVDILESTTFVKQLLERVESKNGYNREEAKEYVVDIMGKKYTKMSEKISFVDKVFAKLWNMVNEVFQFLVSGRDLNNLKTNEMLANELGRRFFFGDNSGTIRFTPKPGFNQIRLNPLLEANKFARDIIVDVNKMSNTTTLTGSSALAEQGNIYRVGQDSLHDLDFNIKNSEINTVSKTLLDKYKSAVIVYDFKLDGGRKRIQTIIVPPPNTKIINMKRFKGLQKTRVESYNIMRDGKIVGTYNAELTVKPNGFGTTIKKENTSGEKAVFVDLMGQDETPESFKFKINSIGETIRLRKARGIFDAKNNLSKSGVPRDKDVIDYAMFNPESDTGITQPYL